MAFPSNLTLVAKLGTELSRQPANRNAPSIHTSFFFREIFLNNTGDNGNIGTIDALLVDQQNRGAVGEDNSLQLECFNKRV